jgi:SIR2-like domain
MIQPSHETFTALGQLYEIARSKSKPLVFWVGAGASRWAGVPSWEQLANDMHRQFSRFEKDYQKALATEYLESQKCPSVFSLCCAASSQRYHSVIVDTLKGSNGKIPVYKRFINAISSFETVRILTTNADELLEQHLAAKIILPANLEQIPSLLTSGESFVAKLHGSVSDIGSLVFTDEEYAAAIASEAYIRNVSRVLESTCVVFIGYGLADEYILNILNKSDKLSSIFGEGPHFTFLSGASPSLPPSIKRIEYQPNYHTDHRSPISVIEELSIRLKGNQKESPPESKPSISAHMLSDIFCAGDFTTSQTLALEDPHGNRSYLEVGQGFDSREANPAFARSLHDLIVGLICFDYIYVPLSNLAVIINLIGQSGIDNLIDFDILRFVRYDTVDGLAFSQLDANLGNLVSFSVTRSPKDQPYSNFDLIKKSVKPLPGKEAAATDFINKIESKIVTTAPESNDESLNSVKSLLMRPSVRSLLAMSEGTPLTSFPRWLTHPLLRLANVVRLGLVCREMQICSIQFASGNATLAGPAFTSTFSDEVAEDVASYIVAGKFGTNLGAVATQDPEWLPKILRFRNSVEGSNLRSEIFHSLQRSEGNEVYATINASLSKAIPKAILAGAQTAFSQLSVTKSSPNFPGLWSPGSDESEVMEKLRRRSRDKFLDLCRQNKCGPYDVCLCGSGEKAKFCCGEALKASWS